MNAKTKQIKNQLQLAAAKDNNTGRYAKQPPLTDTRESDKLEIDYFHLYESLYRKEITDWQNSRTIRYDPFNPVTYPIQQLYKDSMLDNHLQGAVENRILRVVNKEIVLKDPEGKQDVERTKPFQKRWMRHIIRKAMESKAYGYSMIKAIFRSTGYFQIFVSSNVANFEVKIQSIFIVQFIYICKLKRILATVLFVIYIFSF